MYVCYLGQITMDECRDTKHSLNSYMCYTYNSQNRGKGDKHLKMVLIGIYFVQMYHV